MMMTNRKISRPILNLCGITPLKKTLWISWALLAFSLAFVTCGDEDASSSADAGEDVVSSDASGGQEIDAGQFGRIVYVATNGSDSADGSIARPWATAQHAADTAAPGTLVYFRGGTYRQGFSTTRSGSAGSKIAFAAYPGEKPIFDGAGVDRSNGIIVSHDHVILHGLTVSRWESNAVWIEHAANFAITDCVVHDVPYGVGVGPGSHDFTVTGCEAHHFLGYGFDVTCEAGSECYGGVFRDCVAHTASDPDQNVDGFALGHLHTRNFRFERCTTYDVYDGFDVSARDTTLTSCVARRCTNGGYKLWQSGIVLSNCLAYDNPQTNVELDWSGEVGPTSGTTLVNCTLINAGVFNVVVENGASELRMFNTIIGGGDNIGLCFLEGSAARYTGGHNLFHNDNQDRLIVVFSADREYAMGAFAAWQSDTGQDASSFTHTALSDAFTNLAGGDFHLAAGSPAIDRADCARAPAIDFDGAARPQGASCDIGAYERLQ
jgi:hypothetical protein